MKNIRIIKTPPGFAPEEIRAQWVGIEIPLATEDEINQDPVSKVMRIGCDNINGHIVLRSKAVQALRAAGKHDAADFWAALLLGRYLEFKKEVCEVF